MQAFLGGLVSMKPRMKHLNAVRKLQLTLRDRQFSISFFESLRYDSDRLEG